MTARDDLARVLGEHTSFGWDGEDSHLCHCGQPLGPSGATWLNAEPLWRAHLADAVVREWLPSVEAEKAEAWDAGYMAACDDHGHDGSDQKTANPLWARYAALRGDA